jgi:FtsH-binding integral membrane protein
MLNVYNYMASGLALTGIFAYLAANYAPITNALYSFQDGRMSQTGLGLLVMIAPLGFMLVMSFGVNKLSFTALQGLFWAFAAIMGLSLSSIFFVYTGASIVKAFFITSIVFGSMSMIGYTTKKDLTAMGTYLMMALIGVIIASIVNMFLKSSGMEFILSIASVIIFVGLTAYDTQKIKATYYGMRGNVDYMAKASIMSALTLYLDFINIFVQMLRFFGERK